ncbi:MAG: hypothetical protein VX309_00305 [Pseudomonadota bacterium]|nr:hypothetical protein [Pseudomonadota bacterium]
MFKILAAILPTSSVASLIAGISVFAERLAAAEAAQLNEADRLEAEAKALRASAAQAGKTATALTNAVR